MTWTSKLSPSELDFVQSIVDQIPEASGVRVAFVNILEKLAEADKKKYRIQEDGSDDVIETLGGARAVLDWLEDSDHVVMNIDSDGDDDIVTVEYRD